jgi:hypothetical protein
VIEFLPQFIQHRLHLAQLAQETGARIRLTAQRHLHIKGMAMQASVLRRAGIQVMRRVETEFLRQLDHGAGLWRLAPEGSRRSEFLPDLRA